MAIDYSKWPLLVEECMEWIAKRWTKSMIRAELRDNFKEDIDWRMCQRIISAAKAEIRRIYNIDASEYRGRQISLYELIIREQKYFDEFIKVAERLKAAERLDKLFNLEGIQIEDADAIADRIRSALHEIDENQFTEVPDHARDKLERLRKTYNDAQRTGDVKSKDGQQSGEGIPKGQQEPPASPTDGTETARSAEDEQVPEQSTAEEGNESIANSDKEIDSGDIEDVATFDSLPEEMKEFLTNPKHDNAFKDFAKKKKRRKDID